MDTINGFPIIAMWPTGSPARPECPGRLIVVDRGPEHEEQYVVAWQRFYADEWQSAWGQSVYCRDLAIAREMFVARVQKEVL